MAKKIKKLSYSKKKKSSFPLAGLAVIAIVIGVGAFGFNYFNQNNQSVLGATANANTDNVSYPPKSDPQSNINKKTASVSKKPSGEIINWYTTLYDSDQSYNGNLTNVHFDFLWNTKNNTVNYKPVSSANSNDQGQCWGITRVRNSTNWQQIVTGQGHYYPDPVHDVLIFWCDIKFLYQGEYRFTAYPRVKAYPDGTWFGYQ